MCTSKKRFDANKVTVTANDGFPYIVRMGSNNGRKGYIQEDELHLNPGNTISFGQDTATIYYQKDPYFTGDKIKVLVPKTEGFNSRTAQFFISSMNLSFSTFGWGSSSFEVKVLEAQLLRLPVRNGEIDFDFMEEFVAELEATRLAELEAYLEATGLRDYTLTPPEIEALNRFDTIDWQSRNVTDVFTVRNTKNLLSRDVVQGSGMVPYLGAGANDNSVISFIDYDAGYLEQGNCVFIGGKTFVVTYQPQEFYSNDSHNLALYVNAFEATRNNQLFMATCLRAGLEHKYSWGNSISSKKIKKDTLRLPIHSQAGQIDADYMEPLITAVAKLVIKDVVDFADRRIAATEQVISA